MPEHDIRALHSGIDKLIQTVDRQTREMRPLLASLEKLPEIARDTQKATQTGLSDLQTVIVQVELAGVHTEIESGRLSVEAEQEVLKSKIDELNDDLARISDRYRALLLKVDQHTEEQIRALDEPVLALIERLYPQLIERPYAGRLVPGRRRLRSHGARTHEGRATVLAQTLDRLRSAAEEFIKAMSATMRSLQERAVPEGHLDGEYIIPIHVLMHGDYITVSARQCNMHAKSLIEERLQKKFTTGSLQLTKEMDGACAEALRQELDRRAKEEEGTRRRAASALMKAMDQQQFKALVLST